MSPFSFKKRPVTVGAVVTTALTVAMMSSSLLQGSAAMARPIQPIFNHYLATHADDDSQRATGDPTPPDGGDAASLQAEANSAYPSNVVKYDQVQGAIKAFQSQSLRPSGRDNDRQSWKLVGPSNGNVPGPVTYTGLPTTNSGRVTALAVSNHCDKGSCTVWLGAAGGGVWKTDDALATVPTWHNVSKGLASNAIGSITLDPTDHSGKTLYVGTGEENGSSDSEAGVGLYKSTNYGESWKLLPGSVPAAKDRAIGWVAIDPVNSKHVYIGTDVARHGSSTVNGGRFTPPDAPQIGLYESNDGGATFKLVFDKPSDTVNPASPNGSDFFRGGVSKILFDRTGLTKNQPSTVYLSVFDYGLYRRSGNGVFEQVFASAGGGTVAQSLASRTEFALAPMGNKLRIYLGDATSTGANLYRVDDASVLASTLTDGTTNPGWILLSNPTKGTPGYTSYNFCGGQCSYDMPVSSPPGQPDTVWIGGQMQYDEIFTPNPPTNGRTVQRSTNAGASFTDMTNDLPKNSQPPLGLHPDQHSIVFDPGNPNIAFMGSDGGIYRNDGKFTDFSADCDNRGISGADLALCKISLSSIPVNLVSMNKGLSTIQFQSISVDPNNPKGQIMGGSQDNGTWAYSSKANPTWIESVGGDGGNSGFNVGNSNIRIHTYTGPDGDVNFRGSDPLGWDFVSDPLDASGEAASFYVPLITDPKVAGTIFVGLQHVWRTTDNGGSQAYLDQHCNEFTGDFKATCGDWVPLGGTSASTDLTGPAFGADKGGSYVVATTRASSDNNTLWSATRLGRLFISKNADATDASTVTFNRIDTAAQPARFISGIAVDPKNANHAYVTYSGYNAYTQATPGHVFDVTYNPTTGKATWKDISNDLGDMPVTGVAYSSLDHGLFISTDFGVLRKHGNSWVPAAPGLPMVAVYGLTISPKGNILYAATHGRSAWRLSLDD